MRRKKKRYRQHLFAPLWSQLFYFIFEKYMVSITFFFYFSIINYKEKGKKGGKNK